MEGKNDRSEAIGNLANTCSSSTPKDILKKLHLDGLPSKEEVYREIEESLLLPKTRMPDHWLPTYQM